MRNLSLSLRYNLFNKTTAEEKENEEQKKNEGGIEQVNRIQ